MGGNMSLLPKVIYTSVTAGFSDLVGLKVGTSLAKAGNMVRTFDAAAAMQMGKQFMKSGT